MSRGRLTWQKELPAELEKTATVAVALASAKTSYRINAFAGKYVAVLFTLSGEGPGTINYFLGEFDSEEAAKAAIANDWNGGART